MKLKLEDLQPAESTFTLSEKAGKIYTLKKFSLADQIWAKQHFGDRLSQIFEKVEVGSIAELAFRLLKDKTDFPDFNAFAESIVTHKDKIDLVKALLATIGISQPILDGFQKELDSPNV